MTPAGTARLEQAARAALDAHDALSAAQAAGDAFEMGDRDLPVDTAGWLSWYEGCKPLWTRFPRAMNDLEGTGYQDGHEPARFRPFCDAVLAGGAGRTGVPEQAAADLARAGGCDARAGQTPGRAVSGQAGQAPAEPVVVYGPHCSHDECAWVTCDGTGLAEFACRKPGCPYCGAPPVTEPEHWAGDPARVAAMTPDDQARVAAYLGRYPMVRRGPDDSADRLSEPDEPGPDDDDPGPEVDDEGGMSEYRHAPCEPEPWS